MILVRHASAADVPQMIDIARHAVTAAQWSREQYDQMFSSGRLVLVIEEDSRIAGFLVARSTTDEWEIENIAIAGTARRRGLGSRLLGEFLHHAGCNEARAVFLEVRESNRAARALYERWAFVEAGRRKGYYHEPQEDALVLKFYFPQKC
jgi:[ribosomal protein S18]-alanine N-acetyltransferase